MRFHCKYICYYTAIPQMYGKFGRSRLDLGCMAKHWILSKLQFFCAAKILINIATIGMVNNHINEVADY